MMGAIGLDANTLVIGIVIFLARIGDVSIGTLRTISVVRGRVAMSFLLGFVEITLWIIIITKVIGDLTERPLLIVFYAGGFATGTVVGMLLERRFSYGLTVVKIINAPNGHSMAERLRTGNCTVTVFDGEGAGGPVSELTVVCRRNRIARVLKAVREIDPEAVYTTEAAGSVARPRYFLQPPSGWRAVLKKK